MPEYRVSEQDVGLTLEEFLARKIPAAPLAYLRHLVKSGKIKNHQTELRLEHLVEPDETIQLPESNRLLSLIAKAEKTPEILFESREILILNKPSGLAIHRSRGHETDNLTDRINHWSTGGFSIAPIHRLDLQTSGPVLFGKGKKSCSELGKLMMVGGMIKTYLALVQGKPCRQERLTSEIPAKGKLKKAVTDYKSSRQTDRPHCLKSNCTRAASIRFAANCPTPDIHSLGTSAIRDPAPKDYHGSFSTAAAWSLMILFRIELSR